MELYGCHVFVFDPCVSMLLFEEGKWFMIDDHFHSSTVRFYQIGQKDVGKDEDGCHLRTLSSVYEMLKPVHGERIIDYLKIDVEEYEWKVNIRIISLAALP